MYAIARTATLELPTWQHFTDALKQVISTINATSNVICGANGDGYPVIDDNAITFNGNSMGRTWWHNLGNPKLGNRPRDDAHEDFNLVRALPSTRLQGLYHSHLTTAGKPYEAGVRATLVLLRHYYPRTTVITNASATMDEWHHTWELARRFVSGLDLPPECSTKIKLVDYSARHMRLMLPPTRKRDAV